MGLPRKKPDGRMGRPANALDRAVLDANLEKPLTIPRGLASGLRSQVKKLCAANPHLEQQQMTMVIRYCRFLNQYEDLDEEVQRDGIIIEVMRQAGETKIMNPAFKAQLELAGKLDSLERSLLLQARARREFLAKAERETQSALKERKVANVKQLKIA